MNIQLKISIKGSKPPVWMRLQADSMVTVGELHAYINDAISYLYEDAIIELPKRLGYSVDSEKVSVAFVDFDEEEDPLYEVHSGIFDEDTSFVSDYLIEPGDKGGCFLPDRPEHIEILLEPLKSPVDDRLPCCVKCGKGMITFLNDQLITDDSDREPILDQHDAVNEVNELLSSYRRRQEQKPLPFSIRSEWQSAWRMLLDAVEMYAAHEPWHWLNSDQIFAFELPDDSRRYYCSVLGANADEFGLAVYVGDQGLAMLEQMFSGTMRAPETVPAQLFSLSLCRYGTFPDEDRLLLDEFGADLEARNCWPMLRVKSPGYQAWIPQGEEITQFTELIRKVTAIAVDNQRSRMTFPFIKRAHFCLENMDETHPARNHGKKNRLNRTRKWTALC
ncbi:plasmid pRiA4b ORF-3 family protein [Sporolactobacillus inulinus]|nr:plasmid pRiA4b ORF-3 family protein [Sporolactobacillus inulinus]